MRHRKEKPEPVLSTAELIRQHYARNGLKNGWSSEQFNRLCEMLQCLPEELGALCNISQSDLRRWYSGGLFPPHVSLHFALIERFFLERTIKRFQPPLMPIHLLKI